MIKHCTLCQVLCLGCICLIVCFQKTLSQVHPIFDSKWCSLHLKWCLCWEEEWGEDLHLSFIQKAFIALGIHQWVKCGLQHPRTQDLNVWFPNNDSGFRFTGKSRCGKPADSVVEESVESIKTWLRKRWGSRGEKALSPWTWPDLFPLSRTTPRMPSV
jgi:hypothetical protein